MSLLVFTKKSYLFYDKQIDTRFLCLQIKGGIKMDEKFMKEKPVLPLILSMSLPMVLSMLVNSLYNIVDSFL